MCDEGVQADMAPSSRFGQSCGTGHPVGIRDLRQAASGARAARSDACMQTEMSADACSPSAACNFSHASIQAACDLRHASAQTEANTQSASRESAVRITRVLRMTRSASQHSFPAPSSSTACKSGEAVAAVTEKSEEERVKSAESQSCADLVHSGNGADKRSQSHTRLRDTSHQRSSRPAAPSSSTRPKPASASGSNSSGSAAGSARRANAAQGAKERSTALRCPAGHAMQWLRAPNQSQSPERAAAEGPLQCSQCKGVVGGATWFHSCTLCFRDVGERHLVCGACSQQRSRGADKSTRPVDEHGSTSPGMPKSVSAGSIPLPSPFFRQRLARRDPRATAAEWSIVSSLVPAAARNSVSDCDRAAAADVAMKRVASSLDVW
mmetsp:Transcript_42865/g.75223  ORF Transcript_42865/g.75223 Transcript_42865/m.75223 type:complete len:381 (-) Transcript_42865:28-1170(-)